MRRRRLLALTAAVAAVAALVSVQASGRTFAGAAEQATAACALGNGAGSIRHVIYLQFDNTHYRRDVPNVASDLEQMPHLLNFLTGNGTLFTNDHTILISHTAGGILSTLTGLYPDRQGQTVSNSYRYFKDDGTTSSSSSFKYWTDLVDDAAGTADPLPNMVFPNEQTGAPQTTPAPWVPFTRAGCDVGGVSTANIELENTGNGQFGDMTEVFGADSPEWQEAKTNPSLAQTDFVGIAIHCAAGGGICADNPNAKPDRLPDEPGGYDDYLGLFGAKYVNPAINDGNPCVQATDGTDITDAQKRCGFPGFDGALAKNTLGEVAQMQEAGVPVTFAYISDAHDNHQLARASGPGEADYEAQLKAYDDAFAAFFTRLASDGIDKSNTLFVVTVDEGDHFAGGVGTPQGDGTLGYTHQTCTDLGACPPDQIGEVNLDLRKALDRTDFTVHSDDAPTFYVNGNPSRTDPTVRSLEHSLSSLNEPDPYVNNGQSEPIVVNLADSVEEKTLHMVNADPRRTPTFTMFGNDDFFFTASGFTPGCGANPCVSPGFAWNHGDIQEEIGNTWVGFVGPGVANGGVDSSTWTDHTNVRPTFLTLVGLKDDYHHDGHVLVEGLVPQAIPASLSAKLATAKQLGAVYEQLNAPFGQFAEETLKASTRAIQSTDEDTYNSIETQIAALTKHRDAVAAQIKAALDAAAFDGTSLPAKANGLIGQAQSVIADATALGG
jgi:hypothetical protein